VILGTIIGTIAIVALTIAIGMVADKKLGLVPKPEQLAEPRKLPSHAAGEAPSVAIRAGSAQLERLRTTQRCQACRTVLPAATDDEAIRYGDRKLLVLAFRCSKCSVARSLYIEPTE
jgi:hypothetical protein